MGVLPSLVRHIEEEQLYRAYVCEALHLAPQNKYITARYPEMIKPHKEDTRSPEAIAAEIIEKAGLTVE